MRTIKIIVLFFLLTAEIFANTLLRGPYLQNTTRESITICFETEEECIGNVIFGKDKKALKNKYEEESAKTSHEIKLSNLSSSTKYYYQVKCGNYSSEIYHFKTAVPKNKSFKFVIIGDTRTQHHIHQSLVDKIVKVNPDLVINTGDLVNDGENLDDWEMFFKINKDLIVNTPYYPTLGNHERDSRNYFDIFSLPNNERYYSFDWGDIHFIILDSNIPYLKLKEQSEWLQKDLQENKLAKFKLVFFHHPYYSTNRFPFRQPYYQTIREVWGKILKEGEVDAVICGHDHFYQRDEEEGIHYIVSGGGGAPLHYIGEYLPTTKKAEKVHHFIVASFKDKKLIFEVISGEGKIIDSFEIIK